VPRRPRADMGGIPPPTRNELCTYTEVTELTFRRKEHTTETVGPSRQYPTAFAASMCRGRLLPSLRASWSLPSPCVLLFSVGAF
jgi:hypothetical protein